MRNGSLTGKDVKKDSLSGKQIRESRLRKVPASKIADRAATAGTAATAGNANTVGGKGAGELGVRAYAYVQADGTLDPARSKNVTGFVPPAPFAHVRCFQLPFTPNIGIGTSAATDFPKIVGVVTERSAIDAVCVSAGAEALAYVITDDRVASNSAFSVLFE